MAERVSSEFKSQYCKKKKKTQVTGDLEPV
jgi:hypothetical protein